MRQQGGFSREMNWLELSLTVNGEMAEAVAEVLSRYVSGVVIESTAIEANAEDEGHPIGPLRVCAYLPAGPQLEEIRQKIEESLWHLGRIRPLPEVEVRPVQEIDWAEAWKVHYKPIPVGQRLMVVPSWLDSPDERRIAIRIEPGMAFGTGTHPTTQLCLEMMEGHIPPGGDVLDIGCGSGILSIAALKLGAGRAFGVDVEPEALSAAQGNAALNGVASQLTVARGSIDEVKAGVFPIRQAPLVLANILASILTRLLDAGMADLVTPGGVLILSGILEEQLPEMQQKITGCNLRLLDQRQIDDWVALSVTRK